MLVFAGVQLAACARGQRGERGAAVLLLTAAVTLAMGNVAVGVVAGETQDECEGPLFNRSTQIHVLAPSTVLTAGMSE